MKKLLITILSMLLSASIFTGCASANSTSMTEVSSTESAQSFSTSDRSKTPDNKKDGLKERKGHENDENGPRMGERGGNNSKVKLTDEQTAVIESVKNTFETLTYADPQNGVTLEYSLFIPEDYDPDNTYPLLMFIPDSSASGKSSEEILAQYYGADIWASKEEQKKHPSFIFCPAFSETVVDDNFQTSKQIDTAVQIINQLKKEYSIDSSRIYTTGQSMGCMTSLYLNSIYPDLFAASLYVSGQWDIKVLKPLEDQTFFYVTCEGDQKASSGQNEVMEMFKNDEIQYSFLDAFDPNLDITQKEAKVSHLIKEGNNANFIRFNGLDHMSSFNYAYDLTSVRDWLFEQSR